MLLIVSPTEHLDKDHLGLEVLIRAQMQRIKYCGLVSLLRVAI